jgi:ribosome biogenesis GTPase
MTIDRLGWSPFFRDSFELFKRDGAYPARISRAYYNSFTIAGENGEENAVLTGKLRAECEANGDYPVTGDWAALTREQNTHAALVHGILPRRTKLSRKSPGKGFAEQVICANMDTVIIIGAFDLEWNPRRVERYLTLAWNSGAEPLVVLNKRDVRGDWEALLAETECAATGVNVLAVSASTGDGMDALERVIAPGKTAVFIGSSGVGKSTLLNRLSGGAAMVTGAVHTKTSQGRHTTSTRELTVLPNGGIVIDTPGLREIELWADESALGNSFADIVEIARGCRFSDCSHTSEPGCAVMAALEDGTFKRGHYENYIKQRREIRYLERLSDANLMREDKEKWKKIGKLQREIEKRGKGGL